MLGEKKITIQQIKEAGADVTKIENAVNSCRKIQLTLVKITYDSADLLISNKLISDKHFMWQNLIPFWTLINQIKLRQNRNKYITAFINDISETMKKEI